MSTQPPNASLLQSPLIRAHTRQRSSSSARKNRPNTAPEEKAPRSSNASVTQPPNALSSLYRWRSVALIVWTILVTTPWTFVARHSLLTYALALFTVFTFSLTSSQRRRVHLAVLPRLSDVLLFVLHYACYVAVATQMPPLIVTRFARTLHDDGIRTHAFVLLLSLYFVYDRISGERASLSFISLSQPRFVNVLNALPNAIRNSLRITIIPAVVIGITTLLMNVHRHVAHFFNYAIVHNEQAPVNLLASLLYTGLLTSLLFQLLDALVHVIVTEHVNFDRLVPRTAPLESLMDALQPRGDSHRYALLDLLALRDLAHLSRYDSIRRQVVFSDADGVMWNTIMSRCTSNIDKLACSIHDSLLELAMAPCRVLPKRVVRPVPPSDASSQELLDWYRHVSAQAHEHSETYQASLLPFQRMLHTFRCWKDRFWQPTPEQRTMMLFSDLESVYLSVDALTSLLVASKREDRLGIVQYGCAVPRVLCIFINVLLAVELYVLSPGAHSSKQLGHQVVMPQWNITMTMLNNAIYRLVVEFYDALAKETFPSPIATKLQSFVHFTE